MWHFGKDKADQFGPMITERLSGKKISKRKSTAENPGGLIYEANMLQMNMWDLLEALEGMCATGAAVEIDDSTYLVIEHK